jgi:hypothetical protein
MGLVSEFGTVMGKAFSGRIRDMEEGEKDLFNFISIHGQALLDALEDAGEALRGIGRPCNHADWARSSGIVVKPENCMCDPCRARAVLSKHKGVFDESD